MNLPQLPLGDYLFLYQSARSEAADNLPAALWHSVFGNALHQLVCIAPQTRCDQCLLIHQCDYTYLFNSQRPPNAELMRKYTTIPPPHIFLSDPSPVNSDHRQGVMTLRLVLSGVANDKLPLVIRALMRAGQNGLGQKRQRFHLLEVSQLHSGGRSTPVLKGAQLLNPAKAEIPVIPVAPQVVRVYLKTPYIPSGGRKPLPGQFDLSHFLMTLVRRIDLMQYFYTGKKLEADFKLLKSLTQIIPCRDVQLTPQRRIRYSSATGTRKPVSGLVGHFVLDLQQASDLWPYLYLGQWLNLGKNASMGFGRYELEVLE